MLIENTIGWHYVSFLNVFAVANELPHTVLHLNPSFGFFLWGVYLFSLSVGWFPERENQFYKWMDYNFIMSLWFVFLFFYICGPNPQHACIRLQLTLSLLIDKVGTVPWSRILRSYLNHIEGELNLPLCFPLLNITYQ